MKDPAALSQREPGAQGILLGMNNVEPSAEAEFNRWYQQQHLSERLAVPGFKTVKRYRALEAAQKYLVVYECESVEVLQSEAYQERLAQPTPWTQTIMPSFRDTSRTALREDWVLGNGTGSVIALLHCMPMEGQHAQALNFLSQRLGPELMANDSILRVALWRADNSATGEATAEMSLRGAPDLRANWVICAEGIEDVQLGTALKRLSCIQTGRSEGLLINPIDRYQLLCLRAAA